MQGSKLGIHQILMIHGHGYKSNVTQKERCDGDRDKAPDIYFLKRNGYQTSVSLTQKRDGNKIPKLH